VRVSSQIVVQRTPYVRPLELLFEEYEPLAVLAVDRQRARLVVTELGEIVDHQQLVDELARRGPDDRGELVKTRLSHQMDDTVRFHLKRAAELAFTCFQQHPFTHFVLGAPNDLIGELEAALHPYLRERLADRVPVAPNTSLDELGRVARAAEERIERRKEAALVKQLRDAIGADRRAVGGVEPTLRALVERRPEHLLVSHGLTAAGWVCHPCRYLATIGRACPVCGHGMELVDDVLEAAVEAALAQHCKVTVCVGNADLDVLGGIGALCRF